MQQRRPQLLQVAMLALAAAAVGTCLWLQLSEAWAAAAAAAAAEGGRCGLGAPPQSLCSARATARGPHQRVIAFSLYGPVNHTREYFRGLTPNVEAAARLYPGWVLRVYHNTGPGSAGYQLLQAAQANHTDLDLCHAAELPCGKDVSASQPNAWRFLPLIDPLVDAFASRDLDSASSGREAAAVNEWLAANLTFHVMRDHPAHRAPILAGMWGARADLETELLRELGERVERAARRSGSKGRDQQILAALAWPVMRGRVLQHDAYHCSRFAPHGHMRPWPARRPETRFNFVGYRRGVGRDLQPLSATCPKECRPKDHQDWTTC